MEQRPKTNRFYLLIGFAAALIGLRLNFALMQPTPYDLQVLGQQDLTPGATASWRAVLLDRRNDQPQAGEEIALRLIDLKREKSIVLGSYVTDQSGGGQLSVEVPAWPTGDYELIAETAGNISREQLRLPVKLKKSVALTLVTDRPIYKPGQTIHLRALALRQPDRVPIANESVVFSLKDPRDNITFKRQVATSKFGIASVDCELAHELIEGKYIVRCTVGEMQSNTEIEVKTYTLPKFNVAIQNDHAFYQPQQRITGSVIASYHFGKPVVGGSVELRLREPAGKTIGSPVTVETDHAGNANFSLTIPEWAIEPTKSERQVELEVTAIDDSGATVQTGKLITLTRQPFHLEIVPEANRLLPDIENVIYLFGRDAIGRAVPFVAEVGGVEGNIKSNRFGVASFTLACEAEQLQLHVRARDESGNNATAERELPVDHRDDAFILRTDRATYARGQAVRVEVFGQGAKPIMIDVLREGATVATYAVPMQDGQGAGTLQFPSDISGSLELVAYRLGTNKWPARQVKLIEVQAEGALQLATHFDRQSYRPGQRARMTFVLTDRQGKPAAGAISVAGVDEAVYSLASHKNPNASMPPSWSPRHAASSEGDDDELVQYDLALQAEVAISRTDRDAILQRLIDEEYVTEDYLDVLNDPDREAIADAMQLDAYSQEIQDIVLGREQSHHSLKGSSFPAKESQVLAHRQSALKTVDLLLMIFGTLVGVVFLITFIAWMNSNSPRLLATLALVGIGVLIVGILLPSLGSARRSARRMQSRVDMHGIANALEMMQDAGGLKIMGDEKDDAATAKARVRKDFPETMLWKPELITDDDGKVVIDVDLADSITTWRIHADAVTQRGLLGSRTSQLRVFQPFFVDVNLPPSLTRGDEITLPIVLYNYLAEPQDVALSIEAAAWFEFTKGQAGQVVKMQPNEIRTLMVPIRVTGLGSHQLKVTARGSNESDAVQRTINVLPQGIRMDRVASGTLGRTTDIAMHVPNDTVEGSVKAFLKLYPSTFSQVIEGLAAMVSRPHGCFEQASSATYPNLLVLDYLQRTKTTSPQLEAKARKFIRLGYQHLLTFEVHGGGFDWFGDAPANRILTAYGLMQFVDMAAVYPVDPALIERTRHWLFKQRRNDGSWDPESQSIEGGLRASNATDERLIATAYIAWSLANASTEQVSMNPTLNYLLNVKATEITDPYALALVCNALLALCDDAFAARPYLDQLVKLKQVAANGKSTWWTRPGKRLTAFHGGGQTAAIETTSLAVLALIKASQSPDTTRQALHWLVAQKDPQGGWHATQSTVLAMKALLAGTAASPEAKARNIEVHVNGVEFNRLHVPADQHDVLQTLELTEAVGTGDTGVTVRSASETGIAYQLTWRYNRPQPETVSDALSIHTTIPAEAVAVGDRITVETVVGNKSKKAAPMLVAHLPVPAGFEVDVESINDLVTKKLVAKYERKGSELIVYLRQLDPNANLILRYVLQAGEPAVVAVPAARVYHYYDPDQQAVGKVSRIAIR